MIQDKRHWNSFYHPCEINKRGDAKSFSISSSFSISDDGFYIYVHRSLEDTLNMNMSDHTGRRSNIVVDTDLKGCDEKVHSAHYVCCILWLLKEGG
jgi:hypothetical protein